MKLSLGLSIITILGVATGAQATTLLFVNGNSLNGGQTDHNSFYISPYAGVLDNNNVSLYCDDFDHEVTNGDMYPVVVSTFADLSATRYFMSDNLANGAGAGQRDYEEIAFLEGILSGLFASPFGPLSADDRVNIQDRVWDYFASAGGPSNQVHGGPNGTDFWLSYATANYAAQNYGNFEVLTDAGDPASHQEFLVITSNANPSTPEPGSIWMLGTGAAMFLGFRFAKRKLGPAAPRA